MAKIAIVGVDGSGKTVLMAAFGKKYQRECWHGMRLVPDSQETMKYVNKVIDEMRSKAKWPRANGPDDVKYLDWKLYRSKRELCSLSFLDFGGELYRLAFDGTATREQIDPVVEQVEKLKAHIERADALVVLVNLQEILGQEAAGDRAQQMLWITKRIIDLAVQRLEERQILLVFSQYDRYRDFVKKKGGIRNVYAHYLDHMHGAYPELPLLAVSAVDKVEIVDGMEIPASDFSSYNLDKLMKWMCKAVGQNNGGVLNWVRKFFQSKEEGEKQRQPVPMECKTITLPGGVPMELVWCKPGAFMMGSRPDEAGRANDETVHKVQLTTGFWLSKYPVTQRQWKSVRGERNNPSEHKGDDLPVENVSFEECQEFFRQVNNSMELRTQQGGCARLPTEAEWEYACRAGAMSAHNRCGELDTLGWFRDNSGGRNETKTENKKTGWWFWATTVSRSYSVWIQGKTHPVGLKKPNAWGICDMHGNVREWCADWYSGYPEECVVNPHGPASGTSRVLRGGHFDDSAKDCRSASRFSSSPSSTSGKVGFRLCCSPKGCAGERHGGEAGCGEA